MFIVRVTQSDELSEDKLWPEFMADFPNRLTKK
jgi:hypothetical protein